MGKRTVIVIGAIVATLLAAAAAFPSSASTARGNTQRFCTPMKVIYFDLQKPIGDVSVQRASVLALTLKRTANSVSKRIGRNMKAMAAIYTKLTKAQSTDERAKMALKNAKAFASNLSAVTGLYASRCLQTPTQPTAVGQVALAEPGRVRRGRRSSEDRRDQLLRGQRRLRHDGAAGLRAA